MALTNCKGGCARNHGERFSTTSLDARLALFSSVFRVKREAVIRTMNFRIGEGCGSLPIFLAACSIPHISSWPGLTRPPSARTSVHAGDLFRVNSETATFLGLWSRAAARRLGGRVKPGHDELLNFCGSVGGAKIAQRAAKLKAHRGGRRATVPRKWRPTRALATQETLT